LAATVAVNDSLERGRKRSWLL